MAVECWHSRLWRCVFYAECQAFREVIFPKPSSGPRAALSELLQGVPQGQGRAGLPLEGVLCPEPHPVDQQGKWTQF